MKFITLNETGGDGPNLIEVNVALIFTIKAKGKDHKEGSLINGCLAVRESLQEIKAHLPKAGKKVTY